MVYLDKIYKIILIFSRVLYAVWLKLNSIIRLCGRRLRYFCSYQVEKRAWLKAALLAHTTLIVVVCRVYLSTLTLGIFLSKRLLVHCRCHSRLEKEDYKKHPQDPNFLGDIYDGRVWKNFKSAEGKLFFDAPNTPTEYRESMKLKADIGTDLFLL